MCIGSPSPSKLLEMEMNQVLAPTLAEPRMTMGQSWTASSRIVEAQNPEKVYVYIYNI